LSFHAFVFTQGKLREKSYKPLINYEIAAGCAFATTSPHCHAPRLLAMTLGIDFQRLFSYSYKIIKARYHEGSENSSCLKYRQKEDIE